MGRTYFPRAGGANSVVGNRPNLPMTCPVCTHTTRPPEGKRMEVQGCDLWPIKAPAARNTRKRLFATK